MINKLFALSFISTFIMLVTGMYLYFARLDTSPQWFINWSIINLVMLAACMLIALNPRKL